MTADPDLWMRWSQGDAFVYVQLPLGDYRLSTYVCLWAWRREGSRDRFSLRYPGVRTQNYMHTNRAAMRRVAFHISKEHEWKALVDVMDGIVRALTQPVTEKEKQNRDLSTSSLPGCRDREISRGARAFS